MTSEKPFFRVVTRRKAAAAIGAAGIGAIGSTTAGCGLIGPNGVNPAVIDAINEALATTCTIIATAEAIVAIVAAAFPAVQGVATITTEVAEQIAQYICNAIQQQSDSATKRLKGTPMAGNVAVHGWQIVNGQFVYF